MPPKQTSATATITTSRRPLGVRERSRSRLLGTARVIKAGACIEASFKRGKGEVGHGRIPGAYLGGLASPHSLSLLAVWFLIGETHRGQRLTPALTLPQVRYGLSLLLLEGFYTPGVDSICRQVQRQLMRNELADSTITAPVSACHRRSYVERYSRYIQPAADLAPARRVGRCAHSAAWCQ